METPKQNNYVIMTTAERNFFESNGYLVIKEAIPADTVVELDAAVNEIYKREKQAGRLEDNGKLNLRNCLVQHQAFLPLLDCPRSAPFAWQILNWNVQMITSHLIVLPSLGEKPPNEVKNKIGIHRDGGTSAREMQEPHPRIMLKIAYAISDQTDVSSGATVLVPGSNRMNGIPPTDPETGGPRGVISMNIKAGDAFIFEQRTWHGIGHNWSGKPRKTIFIGYAYRWVKPMDYVIMPKEIIDQCNPVQKQLLGVVDNALSYYLPQDKDVPLKSLVASDS
ncbi:hypothetical protein CMK17_04990 [Candidatus Poribacteria bacterium]|nr:hypothetical protein [Candidatus Poribacteria bacterium]